MKGTILIRSVIMKLKILLATTYNNTIKFFIWKRTWRPLQLVFIQSFIYANKMEQHVYLVTVRTYNYTAEASNLTNNPRGYNHVLYKKLSPQILEGFMHSSRYTRNNQTNKKKWVSARDRVTKNPRVLHVDHAWFPTFTLFLCLIYTQHPHNSHFG